MKIILSYGLKIGLVVLAFLYIFYPEWLGLEQSIFGDIRPGDVAEVVRSALAERPIMTGFWLAFATLIKIAGVFSNILRWKLLLVGQGVSLPFWYMTYLWFTGRAVGLFLPGTLGLDGYRLVESARSTGEWVKCTTVVGIEKILGIAALTLLVLLTFPFGLKLFNINLILLAAILLVLLTVVLVALLLLLNPRIIRVLVSIVPLPQRISTIANRLGHAVIAYSGSRKILMLALFLGFLGHVATVLSFFGTMMALRAPNADILDIFFISPLIIYASVITPTISGLGVRELIGGGLLGHVTGFDMSVAVFHLGLWTQEVIPFLISIPLLILGGRPSRSRLNAEAKALREQAQTDKVDEEEDIMLAPNEVQHYRFSILATLCASTLGGFLAGSFIGIIESFWVLHFASGFEEFGLFFWGALVYGVVFAGVGFGIGCGLLFLNLLFNRFAAWPLNSTLGFAGSFIIGGLVFGLFRYQRDVLGEHAPTLGQRLLVAGYVIGAALILALALYALMALYRKWSAGNKKLTTIGAAAALAIPLVVAALLGALRSSEVEPISFTPQPASDQAQASPPNILLVGVDTLRADYLPAYNPNATAHTPNLDALVEDSVLFDRSFSQSSWTKPAFGSIFTGLYPETHTATTKTSALPEELDTLAELLLEGGYYTAGYSNNPHLTLPFNFNQGFVEYTDLKPSLHFGASYSASRLMMYEILRRVRQTASQQLGRFVPAMRQIKVTDFYQPADVVTDTALDWLEAESVPEESPFYLFLHYMDPHDPFMDPEAPDGGYARVRMPNPDPEEHLEGMQQAYNREIEFLDEHVGRLMEELKARGQYEDTLIVFTADHGEEFHDHEGWWHGLTLYQEQLFVPLVIKFPGNAHAGTRNPNLARHVDLAPTLLHFAGLEATEDMPGQALYDVSGVATNAAISYAYAELDFEGNLVQAVADEEHKLIHANEDNPRGLPTAELFNLLADPAEQNNLIESGDAAETQNVLESVLEDFQWVTLQGAAEPVREIEMSDQEQERLRALGYLE